MLNNLILDTKMETWELSCYEEVLNTYIEKLEKCKADFGHDLFLSAEYLGDLDRDSDDAGYSKFKQITHAKYRLGLSCLRSEDTAVKITVTAVNGTSISFIVIGDSLKHFVKLKKFLERGKFLCASTTDLTQALLYAGVNVYEIHLESCSAILNTLSKYGAFETPKNRGNLLKTHKHYIEWFDKYVLQSRVSGISASKFDLNKVYFLKKSLFIAVEDALKVTLNAMSELCGCNIDENVLLRNNNLMELFCVLVLKELCNVKAKKVIFTKSERLRFDKGLKVTGIALYFSELNRLDMCVYNSILNMLEVEKADCEEKLTKVVGTFSGVYALNTKMYNFAKSIGHILEADEAKSSMLKTTLLRKTINCMDSDDYLYDDFMLYKRYTNILYLIRDLNSLIYKGDMHSSILNSARVMNVFRKLYKENIETDTLFSSNREYYIGISASRVASRLALEKLGVHVNDGENCFEKYAELKLKKPFSDILEEERIDLKLDLIRDRVINYRDVTDMNMHVKAELLDVMRKYNYDVIPVILDSNFDFVFRIKAHIHPYCILKDILGILKTSEFFGVDVFDDIYCGDTLKSVMTSSIILGSGKKYDEYIITPKMLSERISTCDTSIRPKNCYWFLRNEFDEIKKARNTELTII